MSTPLFFVDKTPADRVTIAGSDARHIQQVLRLGYGDLIRICSDQGRHYHARIQQTFPGRVVAVLVGELEVQPELEVCIVIGQGLTKGEKMDWIVQKSTELGASVLVPLKAHRSVVRFSPSTAEGKVARWQRIARESAKQSGRGEILRIPGIMDLTAFCRAHARADLKLILWEGERTRRLKEVLVEGQGWRQVAVLIGPEGGFSPGEVEEAQAWGFQPASLGARILRTETVSLAFLSVLLYDLGELG